MNNRAYALLTGMFLVLLTAAVICAALWLRGSHNPTNPYLVVTTEDVGGLQPESTIFYRGIAAGAVGHIRLDPQDPRNILIEVNVDKDIPVTSGTFATLKLQGITGQSLLVLDVDNSVNSVAVLATNAASPTRIPMRPSLLDSLSSSGAALAVQLQKLTASLNAMVDTENQGHVKHMLAQADSAISKLDQLEADLDLTAKRLPELSSQAQGTLAGLEQASRNISTLTQNLNRELAVGQAGGGTLLQLDATLVQLNQAASDVHHLAQNLTTNPQGLIYGPVKTEPGPGEPGYKEPQQ